MARVEDVIEEIKMMEGVITRTKMDERRISYDIGSYDMERIRYVFNKYKDILCNMEIKESK